MNISGAEAVVAASSPIVGQGDAACLVKPYMNGMSLFSGLSNERSWECLQRWLVQSFVGHSTHWVCSIYWCGYTRSRSDIRLLYYIWHLCHVIRIPRRTSTESHHIHLYLCTCSDRYKQDAVPRDWGACHAGKCCCNSWRARASTSRSLYLIGSCSWIHWCTPANRQTSSTPSLKAQHLVCR